MSNIKKFLKTSAKNVDPRKISGNYFARFRMSKVWKQGMHEVQRFGLICALETAANNQGRNFGITAGSLSLFCPTKRVWPK